MSDKLTDWLTIKKLFRSKYQNCQIKRQFTIGSKNLIDNRSKHVLENLVGGEEIIMKKTLKVTMLKFPYNNTVDCLQKNV